MKRLNNHLPSKALSSFNRSTSLLARRLCKKAASTEQHGILKFYNKLPPAYFGCFNSSNQTSLPSFPFKPLKFHPLWPWQKVKMDPLSVSPMGFGTWAWANKLLWGYQESMDAYLQHTFNLAVDMVSIVLKYCWFLWNWQVKWPKWKATWQVLTRISWLVCFLGSICSLNHSGFYSIAIILSLFA